MVRTVIHTIFGGLCIIAMGSLCSADTITPQPAEFTGNDKDMVQLVVKVTKPDGTTPVAGEWVRATLDGKVVNFPTQTDVNGIAKTAPMPAVSPNTLTYDFNPVCPAMGRDPHGILSFTAATGTLTYTGGTMMEVFYHDMTSTTVNTPTETIIGANVVLSPMQFQGIDSHGNAKFGNATLSVQNGLGTYLTADYDNIIVATNNTTHTSILTGTVLNQVLNPGLNSRFITELGIDLLSFSPSFFMETDGNLAALTNNFGGDNPLLGPATDGSVNVTSCPYGTTTALSTPEPSSFALLGIGGLILAACTRRKQASQAGRDGDGLGLDSSERPRLCAQLKNRLASWP
jgi:hypothetical protein